MCLHVPRNTPRVIFNGEIGWKRLRLLYIVRHDQRHMYRLTGPIYRGWRTELEIAKCEPISHHEMVHDGIHFYTSLQWLPNIVTDVIARITVYGPGYLVGSHGVAESGILETVTLPRRYHESYLILNSLQQTYPFVEFITQDELLRRDRARAS